LYIYFQDTVILAGGRIGQTTFRKEMVYFLGETGSEMEPPLPDKNGTQVISIAAIGIMADLVYSARPKHLTDFIVLSTG
jgi:hypothetical protein